MIGDLSSGLETLERRRLVTLSTGVTECIIYAKMTKMRLIVEHEMTDALLGLIPKRCTPFVFLTSVASSTEHLGAKR